MTPTGRYCFIGQSWWGPGPAEFAARANEAGFESESVDLFDLRRRWDRILTSRGLLPPATRAQLSRSRVTRKLKRAAAEIFVVLSPHRLGSECVRSLRERGRVVAWMGDEPSGERAIPMDAAPLYESSFLANPTWKMPASSSAAPLCWPNLVPPKVIGAPTLGRAVALIGAPYANRVRVARELIASGRDIAIIGPGWNDALGSSCGDSNVCLVGPLGWTDTLQLVASGRYLIVNIPHSRMYGTFNPQFFDYAAVGCAQIYVAPPVSPLVDIAPVSRVAPEASVSEELDHLWSQRARAIQQTGRLQKMVLARHGIGGRLAIIDGALLSEEP